MYEVDASEDEQRHVEQHARDEAGRVASGHDRSSHVPETVGPENGGQGQPQGGTSAPGQPADGDQRSQGDQDGVIAATRDCDALFMRNR